MASIEHINLSQFSEKEDRPDANQAGSKPLKGLEDAIGLDKSSEMETAMVERSRDPSPASISSASGLSSVKGGTQSPAPAGIPNTPTLSMPHPKKFSHVNVSKRFLEKTSSTSTPTHALSASPVPKNANLSQKPSPQTAAPHPRLVTAKLTAIPQPSSTGGWSRPPSAVSSSAPTPLPTTHPKPPSAPSITSSAAPLPPPAGKVIQPQPRSSQDAASVKKDASGKPVWGNARSVAVVPPGRVQADFPTAAEVAQGHVPKTSNRSTSPSSATTQKLAAEEDTFRGVHLDPNAHHWDEMEEDDDNFLGGVIEFEDGRQYKVQPSDAQRQPSLPPGGADHLPPIDQPVSKEDRFADDFDRSWPRSHPFIQTSTQFRDQLSNGTITSPSSTSVHSPQESSRVLFNERSNRLEPYSQRQGAPGGPSPFNRRGSRSDYAASSTELRRDAPPHAHLQGVQLLQKGPNGGAADSAAFSRAPGDRPPLSPADGSRFRDRQSLRREHPPWQGNGPSGPDHGRSGHHGTSHGWPSREGPMDDRRRISASESLLSTSGGDGRRQLPPHLSGPGPRHVNQGRADGSIAPRSPIQPRADVPPAESLPPHSASSQAAQSPAQSISALPTTDLEEARRAAMHSAAERARLRRQQEEEEREKEKERARKKAAEIEERMKAEEQMKTSKQAGAEKQQTEAQVLGIIEEAVSSVLSLDKKTDDLPEETTLRNAQRHPSLSQAASSRGIPRTSSASSTRRSSNGIPPVPLSAVSDTDTWRRKAPLPASVAPANLEHDTTTPSLLPPPVLAYADLNVREGEAVDVVDFADLGKLVGLEGPSQDSALPGRPFRTVAAEFFAEENAVVQRPPPPSSKADEGPWRRRQSVPIQTDKPTVVANMENASPIAPDSSQSSDNALPSHPPALEEHHRRLSGHNQNGVHKHLAGPHYREAPMSTLNDVISRIKGVLDGVRHEAEIPQELPHDVPRPQKWIPPALRPRYAHSDLVHPDFVNHTEAFAVTAIEPPRSPKPAWNIFAVKLAPTSRSIPPSPTTELVRPRGTRHLRLDVYSWNPPIDTRHRRGATVNDVIFGGPHYIKGQPKYHVVLPRKRFTRRPSPTVEQTPVVNLPSSPPRLRNATSKDSTTSSWRKASPTASLPSLPKDATQDIGLDTVSRSPPPETPSTKVAPLAPAEVAGPSAPIISTPTMSKMKTMFGSDVTFYRSARVEAATETPVSMQFIVTSELEGESEMGRVQPELRLAPTPSSALELVTAPTPIALAETKTDATALNARELTNGSSTPPPQAQPVPLQWSKSPNAFSLKESPSRAPDPEHLKAVWSQTSDTAQIQPVNSLKGIADDLTGVPFSLQDVKSDDGETPPPSNPGPWSRSRMSPYEVTRAFQQVPSSSPNSSQPPRPAAIAPSATSSSTNGSIPRHPGFAFSPPPVTQSAFRPSYPVYSPMMSHAPSTTVMYPHTSPVPRPMVVSSNPPGYGQPVWMPPIPGAAPPSGGLMRSPYPAQLVPYPSPGGAVPMYSSPMHGMQNPSQQNGAQGRPPGMPVVSPVMQQALPPMYASSPVLVHAPPAMPPGQSYPVSTQVNRGPMRPFDPTHGTSHMQPAMRQPPQNGYNSVPSNYARPPW